jgi:hypothetical protein
MPVTIDGTTGIVTPALVNGTALSFRNKIINGDFRINQRVYVSGTATIGADQYTLDRWRVVTSGQNLTFSASGTGNIVTAPAGGIEQVIESLNIEGGTYTLSWTGTATGAVNGSAVANGGQVTLPSNTNATIKFSSGTVSLVQLEEGSVVTPFENRPIGTELALCQRYCLSISQDGINSRHIGSGFWVSATNGMQFVNHFVPMRATPTLSISSVSHFAANNGGLVYPLTGLSIDTGSNNLISSLDFTTASGGTSGSASRIYMSNANAKITLSAEL